MPSETTSLSPMTVLKQAMKAVPAVRYALGIAGIVSVLAITRSLQVDWKIAALGAVVMLILMTVLVVFARLTGLATGHLMLPLLVLTWAALTLCIAAATLLLTSAFFNWPLRLELTAAANIGPTTAGGSPGEEGARQEVAPTEASQPLNDSGKPRLEDDVNKPDQLGKKATPKPVANDTSQSVPDAEVAATNTTMPSITTTAYVRRPGYAKPEMMRGVQGALNKDSAAIRDYLRENPQLMTEIGRGPVVVKPNFFVGNDLFADFVIVTVPQWVQGNIYLLETPTEAPFSKDNPSNNLLAALSRARQIEARIKDNISFFSAELARIVRGLDKEIIEIVGPEEGYYQHPESIASNLESGRWMKEVIIVIGRRSMYSPREEAARRVFLEGNDGIQLWTYDLLVEQLSNRDAGDF